MIRERIEDLKRHKQDNIENSPKKQILDNEFDPNKDF